MKKILGILLLLIFSFQIFEVGFITLHFKMNQKYIAEVLCINRDKPESHCNGCCQLKKELNESEERKKEQTPLITQNKTEVFWEDFPTLIPDNVCREIAPTPTIFPDCKIESRISEIFRPPRLVV